MARASELERRRVQQRIGDQLAARIGQTPDVATACQVVADALVPGIAAVAVVAIVNSVICGEDPPLAPLRREVPLRIAGYRSDAEFAGQPSRGEMRTVPFPSPYARVLTDLQPRVTGLGPDEPWLSANPEHATAIRESGLRTLIAAPLSLNGAVLGLLCLYRTQEAGGFDQTDVGYIGTLATAITLAIDNARLYAREHTIAATVQRQLLAALPSPQAGAEIARAQVVGEWGGGGWCDSFAVTRARTALVACEVSGHGIQAAITMGELRTVIHLLARLGLEPDELLARLNDTAILLAAERAALPRNDPAHREPLTASCVYAVYDPLNQACTYALAHHRAPFIIGPDGTAAQIPEAPQGPPLGSTDALPYTPTSFFLYEWWIIEIYTTSILPAPGSGDVNGQGPLQRLLAHTGRPLQDLCDQVIYSLPDSPRPGDAVLQLARTRPFPVSQVATWEFGPEVAEVTRARALVRNKLASWDVAEETAQAIELIADELVANAIRHGAPPARLRLIKGQTITVEAHDASPVAPRLAHPGTLDEFGRGLHIVGRLVLAWGTRYTPGGKIVWAEVGLPPHRAP